MKIWKCKIGEVDGVPTGSDLPMREAVSRAYKEITGQAPTFIFSGWGAELTESQRAVVENRLPRDDACRIPPLSEGPMVFRRNFSVGREDELIAEIGRLRAERDELHHMNQQYVLEIHDQVVAATIERCAQRLENLVVKYRGTEPVELVEGKGEPISQLFAAAIRKLKDGKQLDPNLIYPGKDLTNTFPQEE